MQYDVYHTDTGRFTVGPEGHSLTTNKQIGSHPAEVGDTKTQRTERERQRRGKQGKEDGA